MYKDVRIVVPERGIVQITSLDERWYARQEEDPGTGLPITVFRPSVTYICDFYPKGVGFNIWLKKNGDEADQIARLAADRGYKVHRAIAMLNEGETVNIHDVFENPTTQECEELTVEEYAGVMSYVDWWDKEGNEKYEILDWEHTVWPNKEVCGDGNGVSPECFNFAGTLDLKVRRRSDNSVGVIDFKTSLDIWPSHEMQVTAYKRAEFAEWAAILQLNYRRNKTKKWKFTEIPDCFDLFVHTKAIWQKETAGIEPLQRDFPLSLSLKGRVKTAGAV